MTISARIAALYALVAFYLTPARTAADITATLEATLGQLQIAHARHEARAHHAEKQAAKLIRKACAKRVEANRCARAASRLGDLLS